ncbi:ABC transporter permease [Streptococcus suis]|nr:ABC transporter permease [Streptococcus suis]
MFKKLLKYEFKSVGKWYLGIYLGVIILSVVLGFWIQALVLRSNTSAVNTANAEMFLFGTSSMVFGILIAALFLSTFVLVINRFRSNIYGRQGYLTMTLPVNSHQLILSKLVASLVWYFLAAITALLAIGIVISFILISSNDVVFPEIQYVFQQIDIGLLISHVLNILIESTMGILLIYFSISVGQLFRDHRLLFAILTYIGISIVVGSFGIFYSITQGDLFSETNVSIYPNPFFALMNIILAFVYYFGTHYIMTKKLNLQ